ncbi:LON peptidase substrate-binding domain-containing protein [Aeromicrobium massiliense]|uniref:LON peptidase substrate-binding domain-containing protein n=1 Tax=Aeromicrobium massiliense TaxID=1464554 RepID=UPI0002EF8A4D|nr:LON peptidase substrate-binding domain-containing protein [Aeromicrobium massiliense]
MDDVELAMFPLGSVLLPGANLPLRVFEPRYRQMMDDLMASDRPELGVVLIERGHEVGGGDIRFGTGTLARIDHVEAIDDGVAMLVTGTRRLDVVEWLPDDPYPRARVRLRPELVWDERWRRSLQDAELAVRGCVARLATLVELPWSPDVELSPDPVTALWQLAAILPIGDLDRLALLEVATPDALAAELVARAADAEELMRARFGR